MSILLDKYKSRPRAQGRPIAINAQAKIQLRSTHTAQLFLDIDKKNVVQSTGYQLTELSEQQALFSYFLDQIEGKNIDEIYAMNFSEVNKDKLLFLPMVLFIKAVEDFLGETDSYLQLSGKCRDELLCRCYGVTGSDIEKLLCEKTEANISELMELTKASTGCGSCSRLLLSYVRKTRDVLHLIPGRPAGESAHRFDRFGKRVRPADKSPFELIPQIQQILFEIDAHLFVKQINGYELEVTYDSDSHGISADMIEKTLLEKTSIFFNLRFVV